MAQELLAAIEASTEDDLRRPRSGHGEFEVWELVPGNAHGHLAEHLDYWHTARGDDAAAEAAAIWAHDVDTAAFSDSDEVHRGNVAFNLACFFARRGQAAKSLPHLQRSLELNPALAEWASRDSDLDPVRDDPNVAAVLAGSAGR